MNTLFLLLSLMHSNYANPDLLTSIDDLFDPCFYSEFLQSVKAWQSSNNYQQPETNEMRAIINQMLIKKSFEKERDLIEFARKLAHAKDKMSKNEPQRHLPEIMQCIRYQTMYGEKCVSVDAQILQTKEFMHKLTELIYAELERITDDLFKYPTAQQMEAPIDDMITACDKDILITS